MLKLSEQDGRDFSDAVNSASRRVEVRQAVSNLYSALQDAIDLRGPVCRTSGRCCRFEEFNHRLFVTTLEMAAFLGNLGETGISNPGGCIFQKGGLCSVHTIRPMGCRVFFCDSTATQWQQDQYARFHQELKRLHSELEVPYFYVEWRQGLSLAGVQAEERL
ncbi:MAG TPA: YkgJ family cysteine cluster protein [Tepidisphaeraceae bacterium]|nr:YkgJ family cysteine cluster protein [Tepidisphaeraceae bacterium]